MIVDLFAGPGGWDEGLRMIGRTDVVGIELVESACATARAAGHERIRADVTEVSPSRFGTVEGLLASPPCQPFSDNGRRGKLADPRGPLTHLPMEWVAALRPEWVAFEQVRAVLPSAQTFTADLPAKTITTRTVGQWRIYPPDGGYRGITETEAAVLQTFPGDYPWQGRTQLERATQIGDAVPPLLAAAVLSSLGVGRTAEAVAS